MKTLEQLLGGTARMAVIRTLYYLPKGMGLRPLARLAGAHPHSVERVVRELLREQLILKTKRNGRYAYTKNPRHVDGAVLEAIFDSADRIRTKQRALLVQRRARPLLNAVDEARALMIQGKAGRHVH